jgi:hypothetical protein
VSTRKLLELREVLACPDVRARHLIGVVEVVPKGLVEDSRIRTAELQVDLRLERSTEDGADHAEHEDHRPVERLVGTTRDYPPRPAIPLNGGDGGDVVACRVVEVLPRHKVSPAQLLSLVCQLPVGGTPEATSHEPVQPSVEQVSARLLEVDDSRFAFHRYS